MNFSSPLQSAKLIKRYKRFLADVVTCDNQQITIHCANTGAMTGCANAGDTIWFSTSTNLKRKYPSSWELTQTQNGHFICVNTNKANVIVKEAIENLQIAELKHYYKLKQEVAYGQENSRIDLVLESHDRVPCFIEIKSVTLFDTKKEIGYFPDTVTLRGQKHIRELIALQKSGVRTVMLFLIQHSAIHHFSPADHIDPQYGKLLRQAYQVGVEILCYKTAISPEAITLAEKVPFSL